MRRVKAQLLVPLMMLGGLGLPSCGSEGDTEEIQTLQSQPRPVADQANKDKNTGAPPKIIVRPTNVSGQGRYTDSKPSVAPNASPANPPPICVEREGQQVCLPTVKRQGNCIQIGKTRLCPPIAGPPKQG